VICATQTPIILDIENSDAESLTFPSLTSPIHTLIPSSTQSVKDANFIAADNERYITVFDPKTQGIAYNLVAEQEVTSLSLSSQETEEESSIEKQVLAALVEDGTVELFNRPFSQTIAQNGTKATSQKARAKQMIRKADAILKILRPDTGKAVYAVQVGFQGPELYVAWAEGGVNVVFERVRWQDQDTGDLAFSGATEITARKSASALKSAAVIEGQQASKSHVNENSTIVESGLYSEDVEMDDAHEDDAVSISDAEDNSDVEAETPKKHQTKKVNGVNGTNKDTDMQDTAAEQDEDEEDEGGELTFGELVQRSSAIDVEAELDDNAGAGALVPGLSNNTNQTVAQIPSGVSLSTVLTQALKTNDSEMLESCFRTSDVNIIRTTVQRLNSTLAGALIQRLAERMASRPGRYGHLLVWVQWTCIAHGGAIAGNTEILKRMTSLYKVMDQRSRSLPSLLLLKGKLDMLDAQINLRQSMADSRKHGMDDGGESLEHITHYAGVSNDDSDAERRRKRKKTLSYIKSKSALDGGEDEADEYDEMADEVGGLASESDEEEGSEEDLDEEVGDMIDIEAEESLDDDDDDDDDDDEEDEEEEDSDAASDMRDFIADSEDDEELSADEAPAKISAAPPSKKSKSNHKSRR
jgi:U3 small nucleolar RNA-associated protein 5